MRESRAPWTVWVLVAGLALAIVALIVGAPLARTHGHPAFAATVYEVFRPFCHQIPERSLHLDGGAFAVCARCTGIFAGFALAAAAYPLLRPIGSSDVPPLPWLLAACVPLGIDFLLGHFGVWPNTHFSRLATGAVAGAAAVFYVVPALVSLSTLDWRRAAL